MTVSINVLCAKEDDTSVIIISIVNASLLIITSCLFLSNGRLPHNSTLEISSAGIILFHPAADNSIFIGEKS